jgi:hypothetical protein
MKKYYWLLFCVIIFGFYNLAFAYDANTTHPELTRIIVDKYNSQTNINKIDEGFKEWLAQGSIDEDEGWRSTNHFFDPIYNRTWQYGGVQYNWFLKQNVVKLKYQQKSLL